MSFYRGVSHHVILVMASLLLSFNLAANLHAQPLPITTNMTNLTVEQLVTEMEEPTQSRSDLIDMYLLGIFELTEGKTWCDYRQFKVGTVRDALYGKLRELNGEALKQRAAPVVSTMLTTLFPCRN